LRRNRVAIFFSGVVPQKKESVLSGGKRRFSPYINIKAFGSGKTTRVGARKSSE
jgi:hypothetical protein